MSTPIETNTEELQEILQSVYNLPMAGGGSSGPDLVITLDNPDWEIMSNNVDLITFNQEDVISTYNKLISGKTVNCVLNATYYPHSGGPVKSSSPQITAFGKSNNMATSAVGYMHALFKLWYDYDGYRGDLLVHIEFHIYADGSASVEMFEVTKSVQWASTFM